MKRELFQFKRQRIVNGCCPGHDDWPDESYRNRRSDRARSRDKRNEHRYVRTLAKWEVQKEILDSSVKL